VASVKLISQIIGVLLLGFADATILSACELSRQQAVNQSRSGPPIGTFIPRCTADGFFEVLQCHSGTGDCWCVDRVKGLELTGSRRRVPSMPNCTRFIGNQLIFSTHMMLCIK